ncbi:MAG: N-acetyltransferase [Clostridia bacterium]|nr:N-acetyltransferase [Clostridia bacterium]
MEGDIIVREAKFRDVQSILRILNDDIQFGGNTLDHRIWTKTQGIMWYMRHDPETYPIYVAELDGEVIGYSAINPYRSALGFERIAENSIYVDERYRRRGVARMLVSRVLEEAKARGYRVMMATIIAHNQASINLHASLGYECMSTLIRGGMRKGQPIDLVLMKRVL